MSESNQSSSPPATPPSSAPLSVSERISVGFLGSVQAALFAWATWTLPWQSWTTFSLLAGLLAALHAATTLALVLRLPVDQALWKCASLTALALLSLVSWQAFTGGAYVAALYGALGEGLFAALVAIWGLFVLVTLPTACWGLVRTRHASPRLGRLPWFGSVAVVSSIGLASALQMSAAKARLIDTPRNTATVLAALGVAYEQLPPSSKNERVVPVTRRGPAQCERAPDAAELTLVATFAERSRVGFRSVCHQGPELAALVAALATDIAKRAARHPVKLDLIKAVGDIEHGPFWTRSFELRPGLDGACLEGRCFMPWQLLVRDDFLEHRPLDFIGDLKFGTKAEDLRRHLLPREARDDASPRTARAELKRIETHSFIWSDQGLVELERLRPRAVPIDEPSLRQAALAAQEHIVRAQLKDGKFRYLLHPFSGKRQTKSFSLARQAGTLLVLCELGDPSPTVTQSIEDGLELMQRLERRGDGFSGLAQDKTAATVTAEDTVLPLVAFTQCRQRVGPRFDALIARLTSFVEHSQRADGSFAAALVLETAVPTADPEPLYAPGQALLGLALLEALQRTTPLPELPSAEALRERRLRSMRHIAHEHWPRAVYPYFFVEENWHCLAARASLALERDADYERFCLDYVQFKSRLILEEDSRVDPAFVGGFGFGNVVPPHNTGAAGFAEALSAAMAVKHARGESTVSDKQLLTKVLGFLLRQQWTRANCFGCDEDAIGAVSEHTHSPITRIDFVQHTWAAFGHGSKALLL